MKFKELRTDDQFDRQLISNVHPTSWNNPQPQGRYNLVVIGAGTAGLVSAMGAAGLGARVALIEERLMGGDCLNVGCVPSKSLIASSRIAAVAGGGQSYGIHAMEAGQIDFAAVMQRVRKIRADISRNDAADRFKDAGIDLFFGQARFTGRSTVRVGDAELSFKKAVIATGARPAGLPVDGLEDAGYYTNETIFTLREKINRLAVFGAGPLGCELAQAFARLGTRVTLFDRAEHILNKEDPDAAAIVQQQFLHDRVSLKLGVELQSVAATGNGKKISYQSGGAKESVVVDDILVAAGRRPNIERLDCDAAGVQTTKYGVAVNDRLQTTNKHIFAAGDVCMKYKFTHAADAAARIVIQNALFMGRKKLSALHIPWCTYTDPEIAHVGMYERDDPGSVDTFTVHLSDVDRAVTDGRTDGFVRIHVKKGSDTILGATIVAEHAGEMIAQIVQAMTTGTGLGKLASVIHPYPTQSEAIRKAADQYNKTRLTPFVASIFKKWFSLTG